MEKKEMTYSQAIAELEAILQALEKSDEANLDHIALQVKRATELMEFCKGQLHEIDEELRKIVEGI
jgi:exodeoxyribonuclease VII small subunit